LKWFSRSASGEVEIAFTRLQITSVVGRINDGPSDHIGDPINPHQAITHPRLSPLSPRDGEVSHQPIRELSREACPCPESKSFRHLSTFASATWQACPFSNLENFRDIHFFHSLGIEENNGWMMINFTMDIIVGYQTVK